MSLEIAQLGQPVLREVAGAISLADLANPELQTFIEDMRATLVEQKGVGLAAPQVFASIRLFLAAFELPAEKDEPLQFEVVVNPVLTPIGSEMKSAWEGCLSFPELLVLVPRHRSVRLDYVNASGEPQSRELHDFAARVAQHEFDHLNGVLTLDRAASTRDIIKASEIDDVTGGEEDE
jgi:peptide deformylase